MINVLKSDFYKLFTRKSFYICGIIVALLSVLDVWMMSETMIDPLILGYDGIYCIRNGLLEVKLLLTIFIAMFISSEFSYGTIKNIASRGISRVKIYLSKLVTGLFVSVVYTIIGTVCAFIFGTIKWGTGEFSNDVIIDICKMVGLFLLSLFAWQCIITMFGFIIRRSGGTIATALGLSAVINILFLVINFIAKFKFDFDLDSMKYWPETYCTGVSLSMDQEFIKIGVIVSIVYIIVSTAIGLYTFLKRDIK